MPSPNPTTPSGNPYPEEDHNRLDMPIVAKVLGTFRGWILRKAVTLGMVASAAFTAWLASAWAHIEATASRLGADAATLQTLHDQGATLGNVAGGVVSTTVLMAAEFILSRIAAKVKEEPVIPKALPE